MKPGIWTLTTNTYVMGKAALDGVDERARFMANKWGVGRLRLLVDVVLREKFDRQQLRLERAAQSARVEDVQLECQRMHKAYEVLDAAAEDVGHKKLNPETWEVRLKDGTVAVVVKSNMDAAHVLADGRHKNVYTLDEIGNLIHGFPAIVKAKNVFPGATVERVTRPLNTEIVDDDPNFA